MFRRVLLAVAVVALPFAGKALTQEPAAPRSRAEFGKPLDLGYRITLRSKGEIVGVVTLPKGAKRTLTVQARVIKVTGATRPIELSGQTQRIEIANRGEQTTTYSGNVLLQIGQDGKTIMDFKADEATVVTLTE